MNKLFIKIIIDYITTIFVMFMLTQFVQNNKDISTYACLFHSLIFSFFSILLQQI
jgi:L-asparagine transporter-like permease